MTSRDRSDRRFSPGARVERDNVRVDLEGSSWTPIIVGRADEQARLQTWIDGLSSGTPFVAVIRGDAGGGKTTMVQKAIKMADVAGIPWVVADGDPHTSHRPLAAISELLRRSGADNADAVATDEQGRADAADAAADRLLDLAHPSPLLVFLDDAQWLDPWSAHVVQLLRLRHHSAALGVVVAHRPHPVPDAIAHLWDDVGPDRRIELTALTAPAVDALISARLGRDPSDRLRQVVASAGGNPFLIEEILASLLARNAVVERDGLADIEPDAVPTANIARWFRGTSGDLETKLSIASLLGREFSMAELASATGTTAAALVEPVTVALSSGLLVERGRRLAFRHDLVRDLLYESMPETVRSALHREVATRELVRGADPVRVAEQLLAAGPPEDRQGIDQLLDAAKVLRGKDLALALACRRLALEGPMSPGEAAAQRVDLGELLVRDGQPEAARKLVEGELERVQDPATMVAMRHLAASAAFAMDRYDETARLLANLPPTSHPYAAFAACAAFLFRADFEGAVREATRFVDDESVPEPTRIVVSGVRTASRMIQGRTQEALELVGTGVAWFERAGRPAGAARLMPYTLSAQVYAQTDLKAEAAHEIYALALRRLDDDHVRWGAPLVHATIAEDLFRRGRWDEAETHAETGWRFVDEGRSRLSFRLLLSVIAQIRLRTGRGDVTELLAKLAQEPVRAAEHGFEWQLWTQALVAARAGRTAEAISVLQLLASVVTGLGAYQRTHVIGPSAVAIALDANDIELAKQYTVIVATMAQLSGVPSAQAALTLAKALVGTDADEAYAAARAYADCGRPVEAADALGHAACLRARVAPQTAGPLITEAFDALDAIGAHGDATLLASRLERLGAARRPVERPVAPVTGWESLTAAERRVVALVGEGLSNAAVAERLFIGRRTVETHLSRCYTKLSVHNRTELALYALQYSAT